MRFFFNLVGSIYDPDNEGMELASMSDARIEAARYGAELIRDRPEIVWKGEELRVEVTDESRALLFTFIGVGVDAAGASGIA